MITLDKSIKEQFKIFCKENKIENMQTAIKYFSVFGGLDLKIDTTKPILELIEKHILNNYSYYKSEINYLTSGYHINSAILSGVALGDRRTTTAFKRAYVSFEEGMKCVDDLFDKEILDIDSSQNFILGKRNEPKVAKKLIFTNPFLRFWFAFISPIYKGIKDGNYEEFKKNFENRESDFSDFIFEELVLAFVKSGFVEEDIKEHGQYWDEKIQIPIIGNTKSGKIIVGACKYTEAKIKKSELNKLLDDCRSADIKFDIVVIFSKNGFTNELKALKSEGLRLFTAKSLKVLLD